jgi:hypothetical protein
VQSIENKRRGMYEKVKSVKKNELAAYFSEECDLKEDRAALRGWVRFSRRILAQY